MFMLTLSDHYGPMSGSLQSAIGPFKTLPDAQKFRSEMPITYRSCYAAVIVTTPDNQRLIDKHSLANV